MPNGREIRDEDQIYNSLFYLENHRFEDFGDSRTGNRTGTDFLTNQPIYS